MKKLLISRMIAVFVMLISQQFLAPRSAISDDGSQSSIAKAFSERGAQVVQSDGAITKIEFQDSSKLTEADYESIGQLAELKSLTLYGKCHGVNDQTLPKLARLTKLEDLRTEGIQVSDQGLEAFAAMTNLRSAAFFHPSLGVKGFDGHGFSSFRTLTKLEGLTIAGSSFDDKGMAAVGEIAHLKDFRTWHTYQTQAGNESLLRLKELKTLWLGQRLRRADRKPNPVSLNDSTIDVLVQLKSLESLTVDEARLSLTALVRLKDLPRLKSLHLRRIDIPAADVDSLKMALPTVEIKWAPLTEQERSKLKASLKE